MSFSELLTFLLVPVTTFVSVLTGITIGGIPLIAFFVFFGVMGMVLVIVFKVKVGDLFDGLRWRGR